MTDSQKHLMYRIGLIIILVTAVYGNTLNHGFVWDDTDIIVNNPLLEKLGNIPRFFLSEDTINGDPTGYYRPVTYISFALGRAIWGVNPAGYHITNLILYTLVVLLFYAVTAELFKKERFAFIASLIVALHPIAGETVNFIAGGRNTLLSALFALLSLYCYIRNRNVAALVCFTVAIFSKEFALLLPMIFLIYDYRLKREKIRFGRYFLYLIPIACYLILRSLAVQKANFLTGITLAQVMTAPCLIVKYALNMINPLQLKVFYDVDLSKNMVMFCLAVVVAMGCAVYLFRKDDEILFSSCWFFIFLLPVINIIPLHSASLITDRYAFFSLMGFALVLSSLICRWNGRAATVGVLALCTVYVCVDVRRNGFWTDDSEFFNRMTLDAPGTYLGYNNLGMRNYRTGNVAAALQYLTAADSKPDIPIKYLLADAYIFWKENLRSKAVKSLLRAIDLEPGNSEPYLMLMIIYEQDGNKALAETYRAKAKELVNNIDAALNDRAILLCSSAETALSKSQYINAEFFLWQALQFKPGFIPALIDMGHLKAEQGNYANAQQYLIKALAIDPMNAAAHFNLSTVYKMQGNFTDAQQEMIRYREAEFRAKQKQGKPDQQ